MRSMSVAVFGPLTLQGVTLSPRERVVLSVLVLRAGRPVTIGALADALWGDEPPGTWQKQLQASISRLRAAIGRTTITTTPGAYTLRIDPDTVDAERFERFAASAREHLHDDPTRAVDASERALALWRGTPYADLASWPPALVESGRLDEIRMELEELRVDGRLRLGEHAASVAEAERLVREAPLRERRWVLLATALYRSGRQADGLAAIRAARDRLADELGAELGAELSELELGILRHDDALDADDVPASPSSACPYRGLQPFGVDDEEEFFGRDADIEAALGRLGRSRFLAVSGASGSGKSSLVRAGVVPALQRRGDRVVILTPEHDLAARIREAVWSGRTDVVIVDQFEEVFHVGASDVDAAARAVAEAVVMGTTVVLVVRSDFLDDCARHPDLAPLVAEGVHLVGPMAPSALRDAIEGPARRAGLRLEPGLVELILRDAAGETGALPHLSHALVETWLRREGATLTVAGYEASGGISGAIAQSADRLYQSMGPDQRVTCRWLLVRLVALGPDGSPVRRRVPSKSLRADASREQVLSMLARSRLVSAEADSIEVAHESLATAWPRLRAWLEEDAEGTRTLTTVAAAAEAWNAAGRPEDDLYRGARLQTALEWRDEAPRDLTDLEVAFLDASASRATEEQVQLADRARRDRRQNRRLRVLLGVAAGLIVLLAGAGSVAVVSSQEASVQRDSATLEALVATALRLQTSERAVSALLAAEAYRRWPDDPRAHSGLMSVLQGAGGFLGTAVLAPSGDAYGSLIPGTEDALVVTTSGDAGIRDTATGRTVRELDLGFDPGPATSSPPLVEVSGDGRIGAVSWPAQPQSDNSDPSRLVVFDLEGAERVAGPTEIVAGGALAVNADGSTIAIAGAHDGRVSLVSSSDWTTRGIAGEKPKALSSGTTDIYPHAVALAFDRRGQLLIGRLDDRIDVIDPASATISATIEVPESTAHEAMTVSDSGIAIASGEFGLVAFEPGLRRLRWSTEFSWPLPPEECNWLAVSELKQRVFCGSQFGRISVFDLADGAPLPAEEIGPVHGDVGTIDVSTDGTVLTAISGDRPVISRWQLEGLGLGRRLVAPGHMVAGPYSFEGSSVATAPQADLPAFAEDYIDSRPAQLIPRVLEGVVVVDTATGEVTFEFDEPVSEVSWARAGRLHARSTEHGPPEYGLFRVIDADTGTDVATTADRLTSFGGLWPSIDGSRLFALSGAGSIHELDPLTGGTVGEPWRVDGLPLEISTTREGDRIAVTYWSHEGTGGQPGTRLAIVSTEGHRVLYDEPAEIGAHVMLADGGLISMEGTHMGRYETDPLARVETIAGAAGRFEHPSPSNDARLLLVTVGDDTVFLYDTATGTQIGEAFPTDGQPLPQGYLRPDGLEMALSMPEGVVVWDIDPEHQFEFACRLAGRDLTDTEWRTYLGDAGAPQSTCGFDSAG